MTDTFVLHAGISSYNSPLSSGGVGVQSAVASEVVSAALLHVVGSVFSVPDGAWVGMSLPQSIPDHGS